MNYNNNDIIIAQSTPIGSSALAMVRVSGTSLSSFLSFVSNKKITPRYSYTVEFRGFESQELIDTCVIVYYKGPKSFTGEEMLEICCHGNQFIVEKIINEFIVKGARIAYPGEFSYRAFKNNKIDLIQAESIAAKISSNSGAYAVALQNIENGTVSKNILKLKKAAVNIISIIEHELDFNEEEITHIEVSLVKERFEKIKKELLLILKSSSLIKKENKGYQVVILGRPNVGKSTLFNKIIGIDKSIITPIKGTTRDVLEVNVKIKNIPFTFYDTAGYRKTKNVIEGLGINKALALLGRADIVLVLDHKSPESILLTLLNKGLLKKTQTVLCVKTKCDDLKVGKIVKNKEIKISAQNNIGINTLSTHLLTLVANNIELESYKNVVLCNERQASLVRSAEASVNIILEDLMQGRSMDIVASGCRDFVEIIEELLGKITSEEILNNIFKGFCVGK